ncbi:hypothetical protein L596_009162 [Steinernema carpocapsae]|uniref:Major facilitator superfamily (MFS) profile domain-containing protein n=1 Tax=Steinernema carpocapsae TaxID=34508 RepID=A0A4U5PEZ3_STECR|nr:hypothetical protein L596_009162 [Steinernema carpocapsae]
MASPHQCSPPQIHLSKRDPIRAGNDVPALIVCKSATRVQQTSLTMPVFSLKTSSRNIGECSRVLTLKMTCTIFGNYTRFVILALSTVCLTLVSSNTLTLNFTIICMGSENGSNSTSIYDYSQNQRGWLFSAIAIGTLLGTLPITELFSRFGMRRVMTIYGLLSATATLLSPLAASYGFIWMFVMRVLQGFAFTATFAANGAVTMNWATLAGSGLFVGLLSCHVQLASMFTMPLASAFCISSVGWTGAFYLQGAMTLLISLLLFYFFRDSPKDHRYVTETELKMIDAEKSHTAEKRYRTPYLAILSDLPTIGLCLSWVGESFVFQIFFQYGPVYLNKVYRHS